MSTYSSFMTYGGFYILSPLLPVPKNHLFPDPDRALSISTQHAMSASSQACRFKAHQNSTLYLHPLSFACKEENNNAHRSFGSNKLSDTSKHLSVRSWQLQPCYPLHPVAQMLNQICNIRWVNHAYDDYTSHLAERIKRRSVNLQCCHAFVLEHQRYTMKVILSIQSPTD